MWSLREKHINYKTVRGPYNTDVTEKSQRLRWVGYVAMRETRNM